MTDLLHSYYQGITQQIRAEVDFINILFGLGDKHERKEAIKGEGNETVLRDLIRRFIPKRYGVGTGVVIDRHGKPSRQCDIVIYDMQLYPSLLALRTVHMFPVDIVYATVEVKTTLDKGKADKAIENIRSVRSLDLIPGAWVDFGGGGISSTTGPTPPVGVVFAYNSEARVFDTFHRWFVPGKAADRRFYPGLVGCLDQGVVHFSEADYGPASKSIGVACSCTTDDGAFVFAPDGEDFVERGGVLCPVKQFGAEQRRGGIDQAQTLLYFLFMLNDRLAGKLINPDLDLKEHYLKGALRYSYTQEL